MQLAAQGNRQENRKMKASVSHGNGNRDKAQHMKKISMPN